MVSHDRGEESVFAKARWFQSLSVEERLALFCEITELAIARNPDLLKGKDAEPVEGRIQVLSLSTS
ncbi:MAG: hypothetical protein ACHQ1G_04960 [Planctomycetota bacterium]